MLSQSVESASSSNEAIFGSQQVTALSPIPSASVSTASVESDLGSESGTSPDGDIPSNFQIPTVWRPEIMRGISAKEMPTTHVRSAFVRDMVVHMYSYGKRPSRAFSKYAARRLTLVYPFLRDSIGTGYVSVLCIIVKSSLEHVCTYTLFLMSTVSPYTRYF